jgi:hypothetical protein
VVWSIAQNAVKSARRRYSEQKTPGELTRTSCRQFRQPHGSKLGCGESNCVSTDLVEFNLPQPAALGQTSLDRRNPLFTCAD